MKRKLLSLLGGLILSTFLFGQNAESPVKVILKLDDYPAHPVKCNITTEMLDYLCENNVKAGIGIIAANLSDSSTNVLRSYLLKKAKDKTALFEFWHHGLHHEKFPDFTYEEQKTRFEKADSIVRKRFGIQMHAFGAPYNMSDSNTTKVVSENPNYNVLILVKAKIPAGSKLIYMNNLVAFENGTGNPEFDLFLKNYEIAKAQSLPYIVLQGHPNKYTTPEKKEQFKKIIQYLKERKAQFITPSEFYLEQKKLAKK